MKTTMGYAALIIVLVLVPNCVLALDSSITCLPDPDNGGKPTDISDVLKAAAPGEKHIEKAPKIDNEWKCEKLAASEKVPTSVHKLRPGDVKIVAAVGDSLTAGMAADASGLTEIVNEYRGSSFPNGGKNKDDKTGNFDTVQTHFTLPNALKHYNPSLKELTTYSQTDPETIFLNKVTPGAVAEGVTKQVKSLIKELKNNQAYNFEEDWKVLSLFIGANDLCQYCIRPGSGPKEYRKDIETALDLLHKEVPRVFVNLISVMNISTILDIGQESTLCQSLQKCKCVCVTRTMNNGTRQAELISLNKEYTSQIYNLVDSGKYDTKDDFTVVIQPLLEQEQIPKDKQGKPDSSFVASDCFHFSRMGHNFAGNLLWNNIFQPVGAKWGGKTIDLSEPVICPSENQPYLFTRRNSAERKTGLEGKHKVKYPENKGDSVSNSLNLWILPIIFLVEYI